MKLVWLRRDLRVADNTALKTAILSGEPVAAIFMATPKQWTCHHLAPIQADFIFRRLEELKKELKHVNIDLLYHEVATFTDSVEFVVDLAKRNGFNEILVNKEYELNEVQRDQHLCHLAHQYHITVSCFDDKCVMPPGSILNQQGHFFKVFTPFKKAWLRSMVCPQISAVEPAQVGTFCDDLNGYYFDASTAYFSYPRESSEAWPVRFEDARGLLRAFCYNDVDEYHHQRDFPIQDQTSRLSPYLAVGILSARQCVARLFAYSQGRSFSQGVETWLSELVWREFYQHLLYFRPELSKGHNFHSWANSLVWKESEARLECWKQGQTGYPIVDAAMRQLNKTGWMHNRLRMIVASFLTKDLHISWRRGEEYFMSKLIDGDYASNNGGWQWCASTGCDGQPYFRIFSPISQGKKFDAEGEFVRFWVPELKNVPNKYIHEPWLWTSVNNVSYPNPIVDHKEERRLTLSIYKEAKDR
jgi:deoxyribodipyrimidine photo-lyase